MKKMIIATLTAITMLMTGCDYNEATTLAAVKTTGTLALTTWFAVDDPGTEVKQNIKGVIDIVKTVTVTNSSYSETVYPIAVKYIEKIDKLTDTQKKLIESGSLVILNGIDMLFIQYPKIAEDREIERKYVNAFCDGCLLALNLPDTDPSIKASKMAYSKRCSLKK